MTQISINGVSFTGKSINVTNGRVVIDGIDITPDSKELNIVVNGNIENLKVDACQKISVVGDVESLTTQSGDVDVSGNVAGSVQTMSGNVDAGAVLGNVSTMSGSIKHKRS